MKLYLKIGQNTCIVVTIHPVSYKVAEKFIIHKFKFARPYSVYFCPQMSLCHGYVKFQIELSFTTQHLVHNSNLYFVNSNPKQSSGWIQSCFIVCNYFLLNTCIDEQKLAINMIENQFVLKRIKIKYFCSVFLTYLQNLDMHELSGRYTRLGKN